MQEKGLKGAEDTNEVSILDRMRYQARKLYIKLHLNILKHWIKGYYYNYMVQVFGLLKYAYMTLEQDNISKASKKSEYFANKKQEKEFMWEINLWCYQYKAILDKIESEKLEELSRWDDIFDTTLTEDKLFIDKMTEKYQNENKDI